MPRPMLFMKTGILEAEPLDFYGDLADRYDAKHIVTDDIRLNLNDGIFSTNRELTLAVNEEAQRQGRVALQDSQNVVYDGFLNTYRRRETVRQEVAQQAGAQAVLLVVHAPMRVIQDRIKERHASDNLTVPSAQIPDLSQTVRVAYSMMNNTEWPDENEQPLRLDGQMPTLTLLRQIDTHIQQLFTAVSHE